MRVTIGKYTLMVVLIFCLIPCLLLFVAGWQGLGLPRVLSVIGPALVLVALVKPLARWRPQLRNLLDGQPPETLRLGWLTVHVLRSEPELTRGRKVRLVGVFFLWLAAMIGLIFMGVSWYGDRSLMVSLAAVVITLPLLVNHLEQKWQL